VVAKQQIRRVIRFLNEKEKVTVFLTSHDAGDIEALARRTLVINHGRVIFDGPTETLRKNYVRTKRVELLIEGPTDGFRHEAGKILERADGGLTVEVDV